MTQRARRGLAVGVLVGAAVVASGAPGAAATAVAEVGWWTSSPFADAPEGGVAVGEAPNGPTTVAAVRLDLGAGVSTARLQLDEAGGFAQEVAAVAVCRGEDGWTAAAGGDLAQAPEPRCAESPPSLEPGEDGGVWTVDVKPLVGEATGLVTIMLVPGESPDPSGTVGLGWEVQFERPALDATEVARPTASTTTTTTATASGVTTSTTAPARPAARSPRPAAPVVTSPPTTATTTTTLPSEDGGDEVAAQPVLAPGGEPDDRPWGQLALFVLLSALVGTGAGAIRQLVDTRLGR